MTVQQLIDALSLTVFSLSDPQRQVTGGYAGDLLSWVMGRAQSGDMWLTIMSNQNVAAVALMADVACVILIGGVQPDPTMLSRAQEKGVNLLGTPESTFTAAGRMGALLA